MSRIWMKILALVLAAMLLLGVALGEEVVSENVEEIIAEAEEYILGDEPGAEEEIELPAPEEIPEEAVTDGEELPDPDAEAPLDEDFEWDFDEMDADWASLLAGQSAPEGFANKCTLGVGQTYKLVVPASGSQFKSSNNKVATVSDSGEIKAVKTGSATIGAKVPGYGILTCKVTVKKAPTKVTLSASEMTLSLDQTWQVTGKLEPKGAVTALEFKSSDPSVVTVSESGLVTPIRFGEATIGVRTHNGKTASCKVIVRPVPTGVSFDRDEISLSVKDKVTLVGTVTPADAAVKLGFATSNKKVATVSKTGVVTAKKAGTAVITVKTHNGLTATCKVTVWKAASSVKISQSSATLQVGEQVKLSSAVPDGANPEVAWASSDPDVASVDGGLVTALAPGEAIIAVRTTNGKTAKCKVTVKAGEAALAVKAAKTELQLGQTTAVAANRSPVAWSVDGDAVTVDADGKVTAVAVGQAVIWATTQDGAMAGCTITVEAPALALDKAIVDISKWEGTINFDKLRPSVSLVIARASCGTDKDVLIDSYAKAMNSRGIPFGVYCYSKAATAEQARKEAQLLVKYAKGYNPKFYVLDAEYATNTQATIKVFAEELRAQGCKKIGCYIAHNYYEKFGYAKVKSLFDFTWIPRYGKNDGSIKNSTKPNYACDLWQYTSNGTLPGISCKVDLNVITGQGRSLSWFVN